MIAVAPPPPRPIGLLTVRFEVKRKVALFPPVGEKEIVWRWLPVRHRRRCQHALAELPMESPLWCCR